MLNLYTVGRLARIAKHNPAAMICEEISFVRLVEGAVFWFEGKWVIYEGVENPYDGDTYKFRYRTCADTEWCLTGEISASAMVIQRFSYL